MLPTATPSCARSLQHHLRGFCLRTLGIALFGVILAGCEDRSIPTAPLTDLAINAAIVDGAHGGDSDFFWLPPTVQTAPSFTGDFDDSALGDLAVEICQLDALGACFGPPLARLTATGTPVPQRMRLEAGSESYLVRWLTGPARLRPELHYRARVLREGQELGAIDLDPARNAVEARRTDTSQYLGFVAGQPVEFRFRIQRPTALGRVRINEIESNGGTPGDWVELINLGTSDLDLSGHVFRDNDDTHTYVLPAGSVIPAGGYLVLDEAALGFGLGGGDSARFFLPGGTNVVDAHSWTSHAATTYGRCPNGTGDFATTSGATKGAANSCPSPAAAIRINEVESNGGTPGDWAELVNNGAGSVDLTGYIFRDNDDTHTYVLTAGSVIPAGGYLVLDEAVFGFGLGGADSARLFEPDGVTLVDSHAWTSHAATTYGRCPNGTGAFVTTAASTKGAANACPAPITTVRVNEIESSGGVPGDWVELINIGALPVDLSGWVVKDNDDTHVATLPAGTMIAAGGFLVVEETVLGFGLGTPDSVRLFDPTGNLVDSHGWTPHAATSYGRCPDGTGAFETTTSVTKGAPNDCGLAVRINEVESSGGTPGDWVELFNAGPIAQDLSGFVFRDNDGTRGYLLPTGSVLPAGGYLVLDEAAIGFGLGGADEARLFLPDGTTLVDSYGWAAHAATTYGRCPNGMGAFATTESPTKGSANACAGEVTLAPWPGDTGVTIVDAGAVFGGDLSGLAYEPSGSAAPGILWGARNGGPSALFRLLWDGAGWAPDAANDWGAGKGLRYPDGSGEPDAEGLTVVADGVYVAAERNNAASGVGRNSVLRYDAAGAGAILTATHEWNLTSDLPPVGANTGVEAITWIPDTFLVARGFRDESTGVPYDPATYTNHEDGLFFVAMEANGMIFAFALDHVDNTFTRVATIASGFPSAMALEFDRELGNLWAICDIACGGRSNVLEIDTRVGEPTSGQFIVTRAFERPVAAPNIDNEGFAITSQAECVADRKPVFWADDGETGGHAIRQGAVTCLPF